VTEVEKKRRGLQRMQLSPGNWFAPPGTNASSRRLSESSEMHVHASGAVGQNLLPKGRPLIMRFRQRASFWGMHL
jgi:hypothetical protein